MATSNMQRRVSQALSFHFGKYTIRENSRPAWCLSDEGERLELDFWIIELDVAIEVQGAQHYHYTPYFHATYEAFLDQQLRDEAKKRRCSDYGLTLIEIDDDLTFDGAIEQIHQLATVHEIAANKPPRKSYRTPLKQLNTDLIYWWERRRSQRYDLVVTRINQMKWRLQKFIDREGLVIFSDVDEEVSQSIFWHMHKCIYFVDNNNAKKHIAKREAYERNLINRSYDGGDSK